MTEDEQTRLYIELWRQTVDVQKHFNDIGMRIRGLALTALTFVLGAAAVALKDGTKVRFAHVDLGLASALLAGGLIVWAAFYFIDQVWYHRLLIGAVRHGEALEAEIRKVLPSAGLTLAITASSPFRIWRWTLHSRHKMQIFYGAVAALLLAFAVLAQFGS